MTGLEFDKPRGNRAIELRVAAKVANLAVLRLLVGAIGAFEDLDVDVVADLRLAVDEAATQLIRVASSDSVLVVAVDPRDDEVVVEVSAVCEADDVVSPGTFGWHVLSSLTDDVQIVRDGAESRVVGIVLTVGRVGSVG